jgi:hypothetical protein
VARDYYYIVGTDTTIRQRSGKTVSVPCFDGPHNTEDEAHDVARTLIVAGSYEVLPFPTPSRDTARQTYNHNIASGAGGQTPVGAAKALEPKFRLQPKGKDGIKAEKDAAWGR